MESEARCRLRCCRKWSSLPTRWRSNWRPVRGHLESAKTHGQALIGLGWKKIIPAGLRHRLRVQARRLVFVNRRPADTVKNVVGIARPQRLFQLLGEDVY